MHRDFAIFSFSCLCSYRYYGNDFYAFGMLANALSAGRNGDIGKWDGVDSANRMNVYFSEHLYWRKSYFDAFNIINKSCR